MIKNILQWLEQASEKYPGKVAFADVETKVTYTELVENAKKAGTYLSAYIGQREPVCLYLEKSTLALAGMFGAVYAGGFYSLLDIRQPAARLHSILSVLETKIILTDSTYAEKAEQMFGELGIKIVKIEDILAETSIDEEKIAKIRKNAQDIDPLYVNFTSGSTGTPKGVAVCHRSVIDFIPVLTSTFGITSEDVIGNQAPFDFDVSVKDIFSGLYTGAEVNIIPTPYFSVPTKLMDYICDRHVTVMIWAVSAMCFVSIMNGFGYRVPEDVRLVMFSGEVMPIKQLNIWMKNLPKATFVNLYGPTEITCNCTYYVLENRVYDKEEKLPIGHAFENEKVFLLDDDNKEVTVPGEQGEICVSGTCLALGYYKDAERTAAAFTQNPLNQAYPETIYHTGDVATYLDNGELLYLSRKDFQIKHLGHRIELGEIETKVMAEEGISRACCLYDAKKKRILCFYTGTESTGLNEKLKESLPPFMVPNKFFYLEEMPMTKNGKIDRNVLKKTGGIA